MSTTIAPESRRALAALAQLDAETGAVKAFARWMRDLESTLPALDASMNDLAVYPLSGFTPPARNESARREEGAFSRSDTSPMSPFPSSTRPSTKAFPGSAPRSATQGSGGTAFPIDRAMPAGLPGGGSEGRAGAGSFSSIGPAPPAAGNGTAPDARKSTPPNAAAEAPSVENRNRPDPVTSEGMETLLQLVQKIEAKGGTPRDARRTGNAPSGKKASRSTAGVPAGPQRAPGPSERFVFSSHRPSQPEPWASAESSHRERPIHYPMAPSTQHRMAIDGAGAGPPPASFPFDPAEMGAPSNESAGKTGGSPNHMKNPGQPPHVPMNAPPPEAPRSPGALQPFARNGEFADAGEQLADLINAALQAQARRRGLS